MSFLNAILEQQITTQEKGIRVVGAEEPILIATPTKNKFVLNTPAVTKMGITDKDTVTISLNKAAKDVNEMFAIHVVPNGKGSVLASNADGNTGLSNLSFNLANIWAVMLNGEPGVSTMSIESLERKGLIVKKSGSKKVFYELEQIDGWFKLTEESVLTMATEGEEGAFRVYALVKRSELPYTPKKGGKRPEKDGIEDLGSADETTANEASDENEAASDEDFIDVE